MHYLFVHSVVHSVVIVFVTSKFYKAAHPGHQHIHGRCQSVSQSAFYVELYVRWIHAVIQSIFIALWKTSALRLTVGMYNDHHPTYFTRGRKKCDPSPRFGFRQSWSVSLVSSVTCVLNERYRLDMEIDLNDGACVLKACTQAAATEKLLMKCLAEWDSLCVSVRSCVCFCMRPCVCEYACVCLCVSAETVASPELHISSPHCTMDVASVKRSRSRHKKHRDRRTKRLPLRHTGPLRQRRKQRHKHRRDARGNFGPESGLPNFASFPLCDC